MVKPSKSHIVSEIEHSCRVRESDKRFWKWKKGQIMKNLKIKPWD